MNHPHYPPRNKRVSYLDEIMSQPLKFISMKTLKLPKAPKPEKIHKGGYKWVGLSCAEADRRIREMDRLDIENARKRKYDTMHPWDPEEEIPKGGGR